MIKISNNELKNNIIIPKYHVSSLEIKYPCELKIADTEYGPVTYTFFIEDPDQTTLQMKKAEDGSWLPTKNSFNSDWVSQLQLQVDSKNYW